MAGNLPIKLNITTPKTQPTLPPLSMPNMTLPQINLPTIQTNQNIFVQPKTTIDIPFSEVIPQKLEDIIPQAAQEKTMFEKTEDLAFKTMITMGDIAQKITPFLHNFAPYLPAASEAVGLVGSNILAKTQLPPNLFKNIEVISSDEVTPEMAEAIKRETGVDIKNNKKKNTGLASEAKSSLMRRFTMSGILKDGTATLNAINDTNALVAKEICKTHIFFRELTKEEFDNVKNILDSITEGNADFALWLIQNPKFANEKNYKFIESIIKNTNKESAKFAFWICQNKDFTDKKFFIFPDYMDKIADIIKFVNKENSNFAQWLCSNKNFLNPKNINFIKDILKFTNNTNFYIAQSICLNPFFLKKLGAGELDINYILHILNNINEDNKDIASIVCNDSGFVNQEGYKEILNIITSVNPQNYEFVKWICKNPSFKGKNAKYISNIAKYVTQENIETVKQICQTEEYLTDKNIEQLPMRAASCSSTSGTPDWMLSCKELLKSENTKYAKEITEVINDDNMEFAKWICQNKLFLQQAGREENPLAYLKDIIAAVNRENSDIADILCLNKIFYSGKNIKYISKILSNVNKDNAEASKKILTSFTEYQEKNPYSKILNDEASTETFFNNVVNVIKSVNSDNRTFANQVMSLKIFLNPENYENLSALFAFTTPKTLNISNEIIKCPKLFDPRFSLSSVLKNLNQENYEFIREYYLSKNGNIDSFDGPKLVKTLAKINSKNIDLAKGLIRHTGIDAMHDIFKELNEENMIFAKGLCSAISDDFSPYKYNFGNIIRASAINQEYFNKEAQKPDFKDNAPNIINIMKIMQINKELAEKLLEDKSFITHENLQYVIDFLEFNFYKLDLDLDWDFYLSKLPKLKQQIKQAIKSKPDEFLKYLKLKLPHEMVIKCLTTELNPQEQYIFDFLIERREKNIEVYNRCRGEQIYKFVEFMTGDKSKSSLHVLHQVTELAEGLNEDEKIIFGDKIDEIFARIIRDLSETITLADTKPEDMQNFMQEFMYNKDIESDAILASPEFSQYLNSHKKSGIDLEFSRKDFIKQIRKIQGNTSIKDFDKILKKADITFTSKMPVSETENGNPTEDKTVPTDIKVPEPTFKETSEQEDYSALKQSLENKERTHVTLSINGEERVLIKYEGTQGGSNEGYFAQDKETGEFYYIKFPSNNDAANQEVLASKLYRLAGILTPELSSVSTADGKSGIASKVVTNTHKISENNETEEFKKGFAADAWLANWDIFKNDNAQFSTKDDTVIRMDVGGSLQYRARGEMKSAKDFNYEVKALSSLIEVNRHSPLANIDVQTLLSSIERIITIKDEDIRNLVFHANCSQTLGEILIERKYYLNSVYNKLKTLDGNTKVTPELLSSINGNIKYTYGNIFDGIITSKNLDENIPAEKELKDLINKFIYQNKVSTGDEKTDKLLNELIKAFPEFISIIGKKQHGTHDATLDIHILKTLNHALNNSEYEKLSPREKTVLKFIILLHDIAKEENQHDHNHPEKCAFFARDILRKVNIPQKEKERIVEFVKHHNWFGEVSRQNKNLDKGYNYYSSVFRRNNDLALAEIFSDADIHSINDTFAESIHSEKLVNAMELLKSKENQRHSNGAFAYPTPFFDNLFKNSPYYNQTLTAIEKNGTTYNVPVLNFTNNGNVKGFKIAPDFDLRNLGFISQYNPKEPLYLKDLEMYIHCTGNPLDFYYLGDIIADSDICVSNVTPEEFNTYNGSDGYGVVLVPSDPTNISSAYKHNQGSGGHKTLKDFSNEILRHDKHESNQFSKNQIRTFFEKYFNFTLSDKEYSELHSKITDHKYLSHIEDIELSTGTVLLKEDIINAMKYLGKMMRSDYLKQHNETNLYAPKVIAFFASGRCAEDIPVKCLEAAEKLGKPILLFEKKK